MPHYKDGRKAVVGDIVRGKGYNVKDEDGELKEIVGVLVSVTPNISKCNVTLLIPDNALGYFTSAVHSGSKPGYILTGILEYGQADHFEKIT